MINIAVMASGRGSNFAAIARAALKPDWPGEVSVLICDREKAPVLEKAERFNIDGYYLDPGEYGDRRQFESEAADLIAAHDADLVALAGFMRLLSPYFIERFPDRIMNIHPSLLPAFRGLKAQKKALEAGVKVTGCTVHFVTEELDEGPIIMQAPVKVKEDDDEEKLSRRIRRQEHLIYPRSIELYARGCLEIREGKVRIKPSCRKNL